MDDPYRGGPGAALACPRCLEALLAAGGPGVSYVCARDCGEWLGLAALPPLPGPPAAPAPARAALAAHRTTGEFPLSALCCAVCRRQMESRAWGHVPFEYCGAHGVWVATRYRAAFHARAAAVLEEEREARALADRLDTSAPEARLELARRILHLERRLAALERGQPKE